MRMIKLAFATVAMVMIGSVLNAEGRLSLVGNGSVESVPDMATINLGVVAEAKTAADALAENSAATTDVLQSVVAAGIEKRDMQTSGLSLSPNWNNRSSSSNSAPKIVGFIAHNQITIRVRELSGLGEILDTVVQSGATNFNGLSFGLQNPAPLMDKARINAVADAKRKAVLYADAAGVELGEILEITESGGASPRPMMMQEMARSAVPIAEGEVSIRASVNVVFAIKD